MNNYTPEIPLRCCARCKQHKPATLEYFRRYSSKRPHLLKSYCRDCEKVMWEEGHRRRGAKPKRLSIERDGLKLCLSCEQWKPASEDYYSLKEGKLYSQCRACIKLKNKEYYSKKENKERQREWQRKPENKEKASLYQKRRRKTDPGLKEYQRLKQREYMNKPGIKERHREYSRQRRLSNPMKIRAYQTSDRGRKHAVVSTARQRARKMGLAATLTFEQWEMALSYWDGCCAICNRQLYGLFHTAAADHWIPINNPHCPGSIIENIIPMCGGNDGCNNSKSTKVASEWLIERLGKRKAKQKLREIEAYFEWVKQQNA